MYFTKEGCLHDDQELILCAPAFNFLFPARNRHPLASGLFPPLMQGCLRQSRFSSYYTDCLILWWHHLHHDRVLKFLTVLSHIYPPPSPLNSLYFSRRPMTTILTQGDTDRVSRVNSRKCLAPRTPPHPGGLHDIKALL